MKIPDPPTNKECVCGERLARGLCSGKDVSLYYGTHYPAYSSVYPGKTVNDQPAGLGGQAAAGINPLRSIVGDECSSLAPLPVVSLLVVNSSYGN